MVSFSACGESYNSQEQIEQLSKSCDVVLSSGYDLNDNFYELVASQTETALGFEITVGVIKNNEWLYPMSSDFPFLAERGLFHISAPQGRGSGSDLSSYKAISENIHFIDTGAFVMESYNTNNTTWIEQYHHLLIFFSCSSLKSSTFDCKHDFFKWLSENKTIKTEEGKIFFYTEAEGRDSSRQSDKSYNWCLLDPQSLKVETFSEKITDIMPESVLSEGLIFASDKCFYNTKMEKVIDLSKYNIDLFYDGGIYFKNGKCTFKATNSLKSEFLITIDKSGKVLEEIKQ